MPAPSKSFQKRIQMFIRRFPASRKVRFLAQSKEPGAMAPPGERQIGDHRELGEAIAGHAACD
jgi:hypothetical protein